MRWTTRCRVKKIQNIVGTDNREDLMEEPEIDVFIEDKYRVSEV